MKCDKITETQQTGFWGVDMQKNDGNRYNNISVITQKHEEDILYIGERPFRKIKLGLAETEVRSYIEEFISQLEL